MKKKKIISVLAIASLLGIFSTGAYYLGEKKGNTLETQSIPKIKNNKQLAIYVPDNNGDYKLSTLTSFPKKEDGYVFKEGVCNNGGTITQNEDESFNLSVSSTGECKLYFDKTLAQTLLDKANAENVTDYNLGNKAEMFTFSHAATEQTESLTDYRYIGANPNNYIKFNDETWRIIGIFESDGELRVKIMRSSSIGNNKWNENGTNDWVNSTLKTYLNGDYYNGLNATAKGQIAASTWYLGANDTAQNKNVDALYSLERSNTVGAAAGSVKSTAGNIGLIYPSDYGYTFANGVDSTGVCYNNPYDCDTSSEKVNSWMYKDFLSIQHNWTLSPLSGLADRVLFGSSEGYVRSYFVTTSLGVVPVVYLKSDIKTTGGNGSSGNPYILE